MPKCILQLFLRKIFQLYAINFFLFSNLSVLILTHRFSFGFMQISDGSP